MRHRSQFQYDESNVTVAIKETIAWFCRWNARLVTLVNITVKTTKMGPKKSAEIVKYVKC